MINKIRNIDCLLGLRELPDNSVDSIVTDPPYGISFMGKHWDYDVPGVDIWKEALRVLKPGGHILCACGTRTQHRMAVNIEDAGFEIRDIVGWVYGSGFPKSHNIGNGWGTALKPAMELWTLARKPLSEKSVADNVLKHGTGGINIDGCRVGVDRTKTTIKDMSQAHGNQFGKPGITYPTLGYKENPEGRFPANVIHDGSDEVVGLFPQNAGAAAPVRSGMNGKSKGIYGDFAQKGDDGKSFRGDSGSAARFFYCAKASKSERDKGLQEFEEKKWVQWQTANGTSGKPSSLSEGRNTAYRNNHPTVKPVALMRYLCRLITPKGGTVLDPFMGSGSTGIGAKIEGFSFIGIEREAEYCEIARARIDGWEEEKEVVDIQQTLF